MNIWNQFVDYFKSAFIAIADFLSFLGGHRWAAAIIVLTLIVRTLLLPLMIKQIRSMREQQRLQPEIARLRQKYRNDRAKLGQETMALYQREGVNPYAACLPLIAQMPVLFAMFGALNKFNPEGGMPFLGLGDLTRNVGQTPAGWFLIVVMTATSLLSTRMLSTGGTDSQRRMQMILPLFFVIFFINYHAGLMLFWTTGSVYQFVQQLIMTRDQREKGWRGILGIKSPEAGRPGAKKKGGGGQQRPPKEEKPQVRREVRAPEPEPVVAMARTGTSSFDALASRRDLEEKRQRRRRNKKKRRRR